MAIIDTHKVFETLTDAGFNEAQAKALVGAVSESHDTLTTKTDLRALAQETKADLQAEIADVRADLQTLAQETRAEFAGVRADLEALRQETKTDSEALRQETRADLRELELRMRLQLGAMLIIAAGLQIAILGFLMALFTGVLP